MGINVEKGMQNKLKEDKSVSQKMVKKGLSARLRKKSKETIERAVHSMMSWRKILTTLPNDCHSCLLYVP